MELIGNNREDSGNLSMPKNEKDALAVRMKVEGMGYREISQATGVPVKTLQNSFSKGGRLQEAYLAYRSQSHQQFEETAKEVSERAGQEAKAAFERMVELSKTAGNEAAFYKANEYILSLVGVIEHQSPVEILKKIFRRLGHKRSQEVVDEAFYELFGVSDIQELKINVHIIKSGVPDKEEAAG